METPELFDLRAPNGLEIVGTDEVIPAATNVVGFCRHEGRVVPVHGGDTRVYWDGQESREACGDTVVIDEDGGEWLIRECEAAAAQRRLVQLLERFVAAAGDTPVLDSSEEWGALIAEGRKAIAEATP